MVTGMMRPNIFVIAQFNSSLTHSDSAERGELIALPPPSERNVKQVKDAFARWNSGVRDVDYDTIDAEVELYTPLGSTGGGPYRGHDGFRQWLRDIDEQFEEWELTVDEWRPLEDGRLLGLGSIHARGRGSGVELDQDIRRIEFTVHERDRQRAYFVDDRVVPRGQPAKAHAA